MVILGVIAVGMTVRLTPDQRFGMLSVNPKGFLAITAWLPAPPHFRILGAVLLMLGIVLVSLAAIWSRNIKSRTAT
jgi:hypothetical protein